MADLPEKREIDQPPEPGETSAKPAIARARETRTIAVDDSTDRPRLLGLARAARALVGLDDARTRDLIDELVDALEGAADVVNLAARRARLPR